jgi:CBS domain-containing protein
MSESNDTQGSNPEPVKGKPLTEVAAEKVGALSPDDSVQTAAERMRSADTNLWPVAEERKLVGVVDEANPDLSIAGHGHDPHQWRVGEIMKRNAVFCYEDEDSEKARVMTRERGLRHIPVVDREMRIVGIFSIDEVSSAADSGEDSSAEPSA